ncbi:hypothetical protein AURDEDRAFT_177222 [Auricularia subglabra TFB-10046 SS5]|uniref:Transposase IS204/IS1001/IS1096/IS1165 DDE domain-containing protein n=1 Tax=Auricularia subglabra (strain TFB-10046 / SS5) TaxID=717982 RepID=J0LB75_AURST|nr:hypothetical protein AURDEDRAFT_177222 [Auricularia subglabra TFB-10046 SS5]
MSIFEPASIRAILSAAEPPGKRPEFNAKWDAAVKKRCATWAAAEKKRISRLKAPNRDALADDDDAPNALSDEQLHWAAEVLEYVNYVHLRSRVHGNAKGVNQPTLNAIIPLLGPHFVPPPPALSYARRAGVELKPESWYLRPLNVVHEFYYPSLRTCRVCGADKTQTSSEGWASTVPRRVHGIGIEELAIGQQLKCQRCKGRGSKQSTYALTSSAFWAVVSYADLPPGLPIFTKRCALTRELFDLMVEQRLGSTAAGFAETIRQLHLLQYLRDKREYAGLLLQKIGAGTLDAFVRPTHAAPTPFSEPYDNCGYALAHISSDVLSDIYLDFVRRTRRPESEMYLKSLTGVSLSIDATFKITNKATVAQGNSSQRDRLLKGGLLSGINENNEIVFWTQSNKEIEEALGGFEQRRKLLNAPPVEQCASDNCCKVRSAIVNQLPGARATLDIFHVVQRYTQKLNATIFRAAVAREFSDALIKTRASARNNITHREQMGHVRKGCVTRARSDISSDGSRIEGSHKTWNSLNRTFTGGVESLEAQGHDMVLRKNLRIAAKRDPALDFVASTYGSHHISLVLSAASDWNSIVRQVGSPSLVPAPLLQYANSDEQFGLVWAEYITLAPAVKREMAEAFIIEVSEDAIELAAPEMIPAAVQEAAREGPSNSTLRSVVDLTEDGSAEEAVATSAIDASPLESLVQLTQSEASGSYALMQNSSAPQMISNPIYLASGSADMLQHPIQALDSHVLASRVSTGPGHQDIGQRPAISDPVDGATDIRPESAPTPQRHTHAAQQPALPSISNKRAAAAAADEPLPKRARNDGTPSGTISREGLAPIFRPQGAGTTRAADRAEQSSSSAASLAETAVIPQVPALTRSAALFKAATGVNPDALRIAGDEWFLFADLRVSEKLCTHDMTPARLAKVTVLFNERLAAEFGQKAVPKDPRAVMSTLSALETAALARLNANNFASQGGSLTFWTKQCSFEFTKRVPGKSRKANTCQRCLKLMYPFSGGDSRNHARDCCTDGANVSYKDSAPYPQPPGVFLAGKRFNVPAFMGALSRLQTIVANNLDKPLEYARFQDMLAHRVQITGGVAYFRCLEGLVHEPPTTALEEVDGVRMLRLGEVGDP